jgi:hypothetical protein
MHTQSHGVPLGILHEVAEKTGDRCALPLKAGGLVTSSGSCQGANAASTPSTARAAKSRRSSSGGLACRIPSSTTSHPSPLGRSSITSALSAIPARIKPLPVTPTPPCSKQACVAGLRRKTFIFLCHAREDKARVKELYQQLQESGYHPWLDEEDLLQLLHRQVHHRSGESDKVSSESARNSLTSRLHSSRLSRSLWGLWPVLEKTRNCAPEIFPVKDSISAILVWGS